MGGNLVGCPVALVAVLAGEPVAGVVAALAAGSAAAFVAGGRHAGGNDQRGLSPAALLIEDRQSAAAAGVAGLLASGAGFIDLGFPPDMTGLGVLFAVILLGPVPAAAVLSGAWGQFCVARVVLFACRRTPLRLMSFLSEAHDRGVLRQAGGVYQFRHNLLQDHLAAPPATAPAGRAAPRRPRPATPLP